MSRGNRLLFVILFVLVYGGFLAYQYSGKLPHWLWVIVAGSLVLEFYGTIIFLVVRAIYRWIMRGK